MIWVESGVLLIFSLISVWLVLLLGVILVMMLGRMLRIFVLVGCWSVMFMLCGMIWIWRWCLFGIDVWLMCKFFLGNVRVSRWCVEL